MEHFFISLFPYFLLDENCCKMTTSWRYRVSRVKYTVTVKSKVFWFLICLILWCSIFVLSVLIHYMMVCCCFVMLVFYFFILEEWRSILILHLVMKLITTWAWVIRIKNVISLPYMVLGCFCQCLLYTRKWTCWRHFKLSFSSIWMIRRLITLHFTTWTWLQLFKFYSAFNKITNVILFLLYMHISYSFWMLWNFNIWKLLTFIFFCLLY